jgi:hypothetical protein
VSILPSTSSAESTVLSSSVALKVTTPEPLNATAEAVTSPVIEKFLLVASVVAVEALPVKAPTNVVEVKTPELGL